MALDVSRRDAVQRPDRRRGARRRRDADGLATGLAGLADPRGTSRRLGRLPGDARFRHYPEGDKGVRDVGLHSIIAAPVTGEDGLLGVLQAGHRERDAFGDDALRLIDALASQASIAITNARLVDRLASSQAALERSAETERTLREIAARITSIRDPDTILGLIVDEARRVLGSDGAHLTRMSEDRTFVRPVVIAGGMDEETRAWLRTQEFPIDGGINGLAAGRNEVVWTPDYATDDRIPHDADDAGVAERMGLGAMAAAPLRAPGGEVIGTLAVSYREPGPIADDQLATLQALADHAAIALSNSDLLARLEASEERYRSVIQSSPDLIWATNTAGRYVFVSDRVRDLLGWEPGRGARPAVPRVHRRAVRRDDQREWARLAREPGRTQTHRLDIRHKDGSLRPFEVSSVAVVRDGEVENVYGIARDVAERERLERELRESEERYRFLVENSPDIIYATDAEGRITYFSESVERSLGWLPTRGGGPPLQGHRPDAHAGRAGRTRFRELAAGRSQTSRRAWSCSTSPACSGRSR